MSIYTVTQSTQHYPPDCNLIKKWRPTLSRPGWGAPSLIKICNLNNNWVKASFLSLCLVWWVLALVQRCLVTIIITGVNNNLWSLLWWCPLLRLIQGEGNKVMMHTQHLCSKEINMELANIVLLFIFLLLIFPIYKSFMKYFTFYYPLFTLSFSLWRYIMQHSLAYSHNFLFYCNFQIFLKCSS